MTIDEDINTENLNRCSHFESCSRNLCPLDFGLHLRYGVKQDNCRWFNEGKKGFKIVKRGNKEIKFKTDSPLMPDEFLRFVSSKNVERLNNVSQKRWQNLKNKVW